jgi:signal transduction histidine kinase
MGLTTIYSEQVVKIKCTLLSVLIILSINFNASGIEDGNKSEKNILLFFSLVPTTPAYRIILEGISEKLTEEFGDSYTLHLEYLETELYPEGAYPREKFDLYNRKYKNINLDLMICVGINIVSTVKENADDHLLNLPAIVVDYDFSAYGRPFDFQVNSQTTSIRLKMDVNRTIKEAISIFPNTSSIYFITGTSRTDHLILEISKEAAKSINNKIKITFVADQTMDDLLKMIHKLPENSLIVVSSFNSDVNKVPYYNTEAVRLISKSANAPVFTYIDMGFGDGSFGGYIISFRKTGPLIGETAVKILKGADPNSIKISDKDYYDYLLDWRELRRWNLTRLENNKKGYTVQYKEITYLGKYKWYLSGGIFFLVSQSILIISLIQLNRKQKRMTRQMVETDRRQMDIIREDRILRIGMITASLSHELNQPLTSILSTAQAGIRFINSEKADSELLKDLFGNIVEDDKRAASTLASIRGLMKLEKREKIRSDLNKLIIEVADLYKSKAIEQNCEINLQLTEVPVYVIADSIQIQQVILNFISNASHSIEESFNKINTITITETVEDDFVSVSVRDYGKGLDESISDRLFEPFNTSRKEGSGVGLAISRLIIEEHQGKIAAMNMPDGGAEFSFKLKNIP